MSSEATTPAPKPLKEIIEELIDKKATDFEISRAFKTSIKSYLESLNSIFEADFGREFLYRHTKELDGFLIEMYKYIIRDSFQNYAPLANSIPITLVALGSFGRQQLAVHSDIDIMLLYKDIKGYNLKPLLERFLYLAWDAGLKIGHRVHEVGEITEIAKTDITIKTALIESRFLFGSRFLWTEYENKLRVVKKTDTAEFISAKLAEQAARYKKYAFTMEPNLKEGVGGLRDGNTLFWIASVLYQISSNKNLIGVLFDEADYRDYRVGLEFLFKLRNAIHLIVGKQQDVLLLQYQRDAAIKLGFKDKPSQKAERQLVSKTLRSMAAVHRFCLPVIARLARKAEGRQKSFGEIRNSRVKAGFFIVDGTLYTRFALHEKDLVNAVKTLVPFADMSDLRYDPSLFGYLASAALTKKNKKITKELIIELFYKKESATLLRLFYDAGILEKIFAPFSNVVYLAQFDGYHSYSVDVHTIEAIKAMERSSDEFVKQVYEELCPFERAFLKLVMFFHDIAKGKGKDHRTLGGKVFATFAKNIELSEEYSDLGRKLILHHTLMSNTALREDLNDEKTILAFATAMGDKRAIDMLFCMTMADLKAVGSNVHSSFNLMLIKDLYRKSLTKLGKYELIGETKVRLAKEANLQKNEAFKALDASLRKKILSIPSALFFIKTQPNEIVSLAKRCSQTKEYSYTFENTEFFSFAIISKKEINLGWLLGKFTHLDIVSMDIFKLFDGAKYFQVSFSERLESEDLAYAGELIDSSFDMSKKAQFKKPKILKKELNIDCEHSQSYAKMTLETKNQHGLLAFIIEIFDELGIDIATAKISTIKNTARDMFLIEKSSGICEQKGKALKLLTQAG
jgi:[protein-PII] uridylyltransferase